MPRLSTLACQIARTGRTGQEEWDLFSLLMLRQPDGYAGLDFYGRSLRRIRVKRRTKTPPHRGYCKSPGCLSPHLTYRFHRRAQHTDTNAQRQRGYRDTVTPFFGSSRLDIDLNPRKQFRQPVKQLTQSSGGSQYSVNRFGKAPNSNCLNCS